MTEVAQSPWVLAWQVSFSHQNCKLHSCKEIFIMIENELECTIKAALYIRVFNEYQTLYRLTIKNGYVGKHNLYSQLRI